MSKAFKCDRCKKCFDPWGSEEEDFEFGRIQDYSVVTPVGGSFDYTYRDEELHLCPECNRAFGLFMQNRNIVGPVPVIGSNQSDGCDTSNTSPFIELMSKINRYGQMFY